MKMSETLRRRRSYEALSWQSTCLDCYDWQDAEGNKYAYQVHYYGGNVPQFMMTFHELISCLNEYVRTGGAIGGRFYMNGEPVSC